MVRSSHILITGRSKISFDSRKVRNGKRAGVKTPLAINNSTTDAKNWYLWCYLFYVRLHHLGRQSHPEGLKLNRLDRVNSRLRK